MKRRKSILLGSLAKKLCSGVVAAAMTLSMVSMPNVTVKAADTQKTEEQTTIAGVSLRDPRIVEDLSYKSGQKVTYDCVYFGSYPQAEVVASEADEITIDEAIRNGNDYVVDASLYAKLTAATG